MRTLKDASVQPNNIGEQIELTTDPRLVELLDRRDRTLLNTVEQMMAKLESELKEIRDALSRKA